VPQPIQFAPLTIEERAVLGDEVADQLVAITLPPVQTSFGEVEGPGMPKMLALQLAIAVPPEVIKLPRITGVGPDGQPVIPEAIVRAVAGLSVRVVIRKDVLTDAARAAIAAGEARSGLFSHYDQKNS
jgi:hypothetical protein